jgi:hypothetical protein
VPAIANPAHLKVELRLVSFRGFRSCSYRGAVTRDYKREGSRTGLAIYSVGPVLEPNAAGIDVGAREMFVAVPPVDTRDAQQEKRLEAKLKRQAKRLGYELVPIEPQRITNRLSTREFLGSHA